METIDNIKLIDNGLTHIEYELLSGDPSLFRVLREAHSIFYRSMIEGLRGTDNSFITGRNNDKEKKLLFKFGNEKWNEVKKGGLVDGCTKAWRFTEPKEHPKPDSLGEPISDEEWLRNQKWLVSFYETLAMVQCEPFMLRYSCSTVLHLSDEEMRNIEWVHEKIRNEYEHFIPKTYSADKDSLASGAILLLDKSEYLLFKSGNVSYIDSELLYNITAKLCSIQCKLKSYFNKKSL